MAFTVVSPRNVESALREILRERIEKADEHLSAPAIDRAEGIHEARKRFKELRACLKLLSDPKRSDIAALESVFRDAGRQLSGTRDAQALLECWDKLRAVDAAPLDTPFGEAVQAALRRNARTHLHETDALAGVLDGIRTTLQERLRHLPEIQARDEGFGVIERGLRRSYRAGRRRLDDVVHEPTAERFHDWRKRVKDHWYHTRLIVGAWPETLEHRQQLFKRLSDLLGDDHDLDVLLDQIKAWPDRAREKIQRDALCAAIARRQALLRREALALGRRLYAEKPRAFAQRIAAYWSLWEADQP